MGMKTFVEQVRETHNLARAWHVICENGRSSKSSDTRRDIEQFAARAESRLNKIQRQLNLGAFRFAAAKGVAIPKKGKSAIRPIVIAPIESRIVQRAIHDVLVEVPSIRRYAESPYSFGGVKKRGPDRVAVPGAIKAVLAAIGEGARYVIRSDISAFFTRIPKPTVTAIIAEAIAEPKFIELFSQAIAVELENLASLREQASTFPIHEIGVAQGNCLSPLLGNLLLYDFDRQMTVASAGAFDTSTTS
jgi:retron-type reverse transcriptase